MDNTLKTTIQNIQKGCALFYAIETQIRTSFGVRHQFLHTCFTI